VIDATAFKFRNLYIAALYELRQAFIFQGKYIPYNDLDKLIKIIYGEGNERNCFVLDKKSRWEVMLWRRPISK
jgi:hypothetical protein